MKLIIAGSRTINDYNLLVESMRKYKLTPSEIVSGGARGVDKLGEKYAKEHNIPLKIFPAYWNKYGKSAGYIRNKQMKDHADQLLVLWDGKSKGTSNMVKIMNTENKPTYIVRINETIR